MFYDSPITYWRNINHRYQLEGAQCSSCNKKYYPQCYRCSCSSVSFTKVNLSKSGKLISFSQVKIPPKQLCHESPYCIGMVELDDGPRLMAQLTDVTFEQLKIGMRVRGVFRRYHVSGKTGLIHYGIKFTVDESE